MADYERLNVISEGTYGVVHRARDKKTGEIVAVKVLYKERIPLFSREIDILKSLPPHPSIVEFKQAGADKNGRVYVVMEYVKNDLSKLMAKQKGRFTSSEIKRMMKQLLEGVTFLHDNGVMHRDLKPSNILITDKGDLKICDFGLLARFGARTIMWYDPHVGTLRYKAPEILLGRRGYSCAVDMWAVGCIMAELVLNQQLFKGTTEVDQLACIQRTICMSWNWLRFRLSRNASSSVTRLLTPSCIDLLERLLTYKPEERISAKEALDHIWFKEYCAPTNCFSLRIRELYTWCNERLNINFWM